MEITVNVTGLDNLANAIFALAKAAGNCKEETHAARGQLIQRQPRKGAAGEIPHGVLFIKHSCSSQLKSDKLLQNESYHEKSPRRKWAGVENRTEKRRNFQHP